ncbi:MAG: CerR family C-terminal domain-containing protein [Planctomycetes bacterium]|nr:CerR family C-terminal domain-containing protein [Planctomycetota bacterium]
MWAPAGDAASGGGDLPAGLTAAEGGDAPCGPRQRILEEASRLFAERGFDGVPVREIASAAGVSHAALNYYFHGKRELYLSVFGTCWSHAKEVQAEGAALVERARAASSPDELRGLFRDWVVSFFRAANETTDPVAQGLAAREMTQPGGPCDEVFEGLIRPRHRQLEQLVGLVRPDLDESAQRQLAIGVIAQVLYYRFSRPTALRLLGVEQLDPALVERLAQGVASTSLHGVLEARFDASPEDRS